MKELIRELLILGLTPEQVAEDLAHEDADQVGQCLVEVMATL